FRPDLLDRLAFDVITLPPLRHRTEDIMPLAEYFAVGMARQLKLELFEGFSPNATKQLMEYQWPGNIRELKNVVERSVYRNADTNIAIDQIIIDPFASPYRPTKRVKTKERQQSVSPENVNFTNNGTEVSANPITKVDNTVNFPIDFKTHCEQNEVAILKLALEAGQFNQKKTAELLDLSYHQLRGILKKYNLLDK
ncbi:helix-turn-helix domain-containing protein, partial [Shewanella sp. 0m-11]